jgi:flagellar basal body-associated protein FliL
LSRSGTSAGAYLLLLVMVTLPLSVGWMLNLVAGNPGPSTNPHPTIGFDLPVINTQLGGPEGPVVTVRATLLLHSSAQIPLVGQKMPKLVDVVLTQLHELPSGDLERRKALAGLRDKLLPYINGVLAPEKIDDLLLKEVTIR